MDFNKEQQYKNKIAALQSEIEKLRREKTNKIKAEKYGLNWIDIPEAFDEESENKIPILEEVKEKAINNNDGKPTHIIIEGDNYHALTCLNYTHAGKIDCIYIDPPYNTGKEFTYRDARFIKEYPNGKLIDKDNPLRHSAWLSFMKKRLILARSLLSNNGMIFISIDDYEDANLKLLCDSIFGQSNFVNKFIWKRNSSAKAEKDKFTVNTEYVLFYRKSEKTILNSTYKPLSEASKKLYKFDDNDGRGKYQTVSLQKPQDPGPETTYDYIDNTGKVWKCPKKGWRMVQSKIKALENDNRLCLSGNTLRVKDYWNERENEGRRIDTLWDDLPENSTATSQLREIFNNVEVFSNPKPIELIKRCININSKNSIVLDFFAGSGTTLNATMELNHEDGGSRQCILIQTPEKTYEIRNGKEYPTKFGEKAFSLGFKHISDITYERNKKIIEGYTNSKNEVIEGLGNSLNYYKTSFIGKHNSFDATDNDYITLAKKAGYLISISENTLEEIKTSDYYQIFTNREKFTAIYFNQNYSNLPSFVDTIEKLDAKTTVYIFSWGSPEIFENEFNDLHNITIKSIPQPILEIYKSINGDL